MEIKLNDDELMAEVEAIIKQRSKKRISEIVNDSIYEISNKYIRRRIHELIKDKVDEVISSEEFRQKLTEQVKNDVGQFIIDRIEEVERRRELLQFLGINIYDIKP